VVKNLVIVIGCEMNRMWIIELDVDY